MNPLMLQSSQLAQQAPVTMGLVGWLFVSHLVVALFPAATHVLGLRLGTLALHPWTLLTSSLVDRSVFYVCCTALSLLCTSLVVEPAHGGWGVMELWTSSALGGGLATAAWTLFLHQCIVRLRPEAAEAATLPTRTYLSSTALAAGALVALKQLRPEGDAVVPLPRISPKALAEFGGGGAAGGSGSAPGGGGGAASGVGGSASFGWLRPTHGNAGRRLGAARAALDVARAVVAIVAGTVVALAVGSLKVLRGASPWARPGRGGFRGGGASASASSSSSASAPSAVATTVDGVILTATPGAGGGLGATAAAAAASRDLEAAGGFDPSGSLSGTSGRGVPVVTVRVPLRHLASLHALAFAALSLLGAPPTLPRLPSAVGGTLGAWLYLRRFARPHGAPAGDVSEDMRLASFFPPTLAPSVDAAARAASGVAGRARRAIVRTRAARAQALAQAQAAAAGGAGDAGGAGAGARATGGAGGFGARALALGRAAAGGATAGAPAAAPPVAAADAARRRDRGAKALAERLAEKTGAAAAKTDEATRHEAAKAKEAERNPTAIAPTTKAQPAEGT